TPDEAPAFQATHELPDGTQVVAHADEPNVWVDAHGDEYESEEAYPLQAERAEEPAEPIDPAAEVAKTAGMIARREHPISANPRVDRILARETYLENLVSTDPESARAVAKAFRENPEKYAEIAEVSPEKLGSYASVIERRLALKVKPDAPKPGESPTAAPEPPADPTPFGVQPGTSKSARRKLNAACIDILRQGEITEADRATLRQYSGNGGCGDSLNEFYTDPSVAAAMWEVLGQLGVSGSVLEPSSGPGVFLHTALPDTRVTAVELDPTSADIARVLHGDRHEVHNASLERFATQDDRQFDAVIGNAPFGPRGALLGDDKRDLGKAEEYFLDTALDKTKPMGIVAMIVPTGIMDSKNGRAFREQLLRKAEFLGAQRMPNSAFEHSHTDVTTDIVYFRKRPDAVAGALGVVDRSTLQTLGVWDDEFLAGTYFTGRGAGNLFGRVSTAKRAFGEIYTVEGSMAGIPDAIRGFAPHPVTATPDMTEILSALTSDKAKAQALKAAETRPYASTAKVGDTKVVDGVTYVLQGQPPRWHRVDEAALSDAVQEGASIASRIDRLMNGDEGVDRAALTSDLQDWVARHGIPSKNPNLLIAAAADKTLYRLIGAVSKDGELSDTVRGARRQIEGSLSAVAQSLALSKTSGEFTAEELAATMGKDVDEVLDHLHADPEFAWAGNDQWTTMQSYLTGELWPKLDTARDVLGAEDVPDYLRAKLELQAARLEETIGAKPLDEVEVQVNSAFIPLEIVSAYFTWKDQEGPDANQWTRQQKPVEITFADGVYSITGGSHWGTKLLDKYLNRTGVKKDDMDDINAMNEAFKEWLCQSDYREQVEDLYNRKFLGFVEKSYSSDPIDVPGLANQDQLRDYQWPGLRWALERGKG
ncbi:MAG: Bordetella phage vB BbrM, partial [Pseudomonadota bacterium]